MTPNKYLCVLTSKHHVWMDAKAGKIKRFIYLEFVDEGPHRDLVGEIASSIRQNTNVIFGLYYSLYEWFNPIYLSDKENGFKTQQFIKDKIGPELHDIVTKYKPEYIWSDGDWEASDTYWNSTEFLAWLFNESPVKDTVVVNDRWGAGCMCHHGSVYTCSDAYDPGVLVKHKWENAMPVDKMSWGFRRNATQLAEYNTIEELIAKLASTVRYTCRETVVYAIVLDWPDSGLLHLGQPFTEPNTNIAMLGYSGHFNWTAFTTGKQGVTIHVPAIPNNKLPSKWAWTFKLSNIL
ncbi:hypothetical protein QZH41_012395 [Actinostola sp. cb2023]|nr:hypothetical protein QZH41_012395 [Actinostola sp. cb2023]